jgi:hypothetical protein
MADRTATERAARAIALGLWVNDGWLVDDFEAKGSLYRVGATKALGALTKDPSLLVDLALEAGGLRQVAWHNPEATGLHGDPLLTFDKRDDEAYPLYCANPTEANDGE